MAHDLWHLLADMQQFIGELQLVVGSRTQEEYEANFIIQRAVEREFILIAEVIKRMQAISGEVQRRIDSVQRITGFRNVLVHNYDFVDEQIVWSSITTTLPLLKQQIDAWADELGMEPPPEQT